MEERTIPAAPSDLNAKYEDAVRRKLDALMRSHQLSQIQFCELLKDRGLALEQGNLSSMLKGRKRIPLSLIVHICDIFRISLAELVDENFGNAHPAPVATPQLYSNDLLNHIPSLGDSFITDPASPEFHGYLQTYYFYMYSNHSYETKALTGTLELKACGGVCEAHLDLNTNRTADGKPLYKKYQGRVIICKAIDAVYILLSSDIEGELNVISFRHFHLPHQPLDCRVAAVLTNECGEFHTPTTHRMFLSRTPIQPEHIPLLLPHLLLNGSAINIPGDKLERLRRNAPEYAKLLDTLTTIPATDTFFWTEDYVLGVARHFLAREEIPMFLSRLREISLSEKANKASRRANSHARDLLLHLGYYHDHDL